LVLNPLSKRKKKRTKGNHWKSPKKVQEEAKRTCSEGSCFERKTQLELREGIIRIKKIRSKKPREKEEIILKDYWRN